MVSDKTWVKICGNTTIDDALAAVQAGADAIGLIFAPASPREVNRQEAAEIVAALPSSVLSIGVVVNENVDFLRGLLRVCRLQGLQLHGDESPEEVLALREDVKFLIKVIRVKDAKSLEAIPSYQGVDAVLLDTFKPLQRGGTGTVFDWGLIPKAKKYGIPIIVAGGLTPENVGDLVRQAEPFGVDVVSGVERSPGRKDQDLVRRFVLQAKLQAK